jgi:adenosylcobinamide-phosphate synthase
MEILIAALLGAGFDLLFGDPRWLPHPVVLIGKLIAFLEPPLRKLFPKTKAGENIAGGVLVLLVVGVSFCVPYFALWGLGLWSRWARLALETFWCFQLPAAKSLKQESMKVYDALQKNDLPLARTMVSYIVGRDTGALTEAGVTKAAVETVAENASDGVVAPLFYMLLGGAPLAMAYKAVNTMDSMIGYRNEQYKFFGTAAARLDDLVNYIPARLAGLFMILASFLGGFDGQNARRIFRRDRYNHKSPNSAQTESVMAGALRVQLAGDAYYFGELVHKKTIGDDFRPVEPADIPRANRLMYRTAGLCLLFFAAVRLAVILIFF